MTTTPTRARAWARRCLAACALLLGAFCPWAQASQADAKVVSDFLASWQTSDIDKIMSYVAEDCHYENLPSLTGDNPVIQGRANMRAFLAPFFAKDPLIVPFRTYTEVKFVVAGDHAVAIERVDRFDIGNAKFALPVAAFFKVEGGKIVYWADYFDGNTIEPVSVLMKSLAKK
jgi:limonene-1,2-epoxide hydrolase